MYYFAREDHKIYLKETMNMMKIHKIVSKKFVEKFLKNHASLASAEVKNLRPYTISSFTMIWALNSHHNYSKTLFSPFSLLDLKYLSKNLAIDEDMSLPLITKSSIFALKVVNSTQILVMAFLSFFFSKLLSSFVQYTNLYKNKHITDVTDTSLCH